MDLTLDLARQVLAAQPFSQLVGAHLTAFGDGRAVLELELRDDLRNQHGLAHGGVLAYLADNAITFAGGASLGPAVLTSGVTIDYVRPAASGPLRAEATVVTATRRTASVRCEVLGGDGRVVAVAQGGVRAVDVPAA